MSRLIEFVRSRWRWVTLLVASAGVVCGYLGFGQMDPSASFLDRSYASLQLLVVAGPNGLGTESLPALLSVGRYLAAAGLVGTVSAIFLRLGAAGADRLTAQRANGHVVVMGSTTEAQQLALMRRRDKQASKVILVGDLEESSTAALRQQGVRVLAPAGRASLRSIVKGAKEVVLAEGDDGVAFAVLEELEGLLRNEDGARVRVLTQSTAFARSLRSRFASHGASVSLSARSVVEAASQRLSSEFFFPPYPSGSSLHLVVIGQGDLARETAISAVDRRVGRNSRTLVDLWTVGDHEWCTEVEERLKSRTVSVRITRLLGSPEVMARRVLQESPSGDWIKRGYVIGLEDGTAITLAMTLQDSASSFRVVSVQRTAGPESHLHLSGDSEWRSTTLGNLLAEPEVWTLDEQLGEEILAGLRTLHDLPGAADVLGSLGPLQLLSSAQRSEWATAVASDLKVDLASCGLIISPTLQWAEPPLLMSEVLLKMRATIGRHVESLDSSWSASTDMHSVLWILQDLPEMLRRSGYSLVFVGSDDDSAQLSPDVIDALAARAHRSYVELSELMGDQGSPTRNLAWEELSPDDQDSNRAQVRDLPIKLLRLGYRVVTAGTPGSFIPELSAQVVDEMAWFEHLRWMHSRVINGWRVGPRDPARRLHPMIIEYEKLDPAQREQDRGPVRLLPELLQLAGLAVVPLEA